jgi:uncharacterized protein (TIGR03000 family)
MYSIVLMAALTGGSAAPDWHHRSCGCHGCYGYSGCHGCHGCWGGYGFHGCWGCYGCYGGYGCYGCYGCWGGYGCYGGMACYGACFGGCYGAYGGYGVQVAPPGAPMQKPAEEAPAPKKEKDKGETSVRARLIINVPAEAKLFIDDLPMKSDSARRSFVTPTLRPGQTYFYDVRAEIVRDGQTVSETQRVILRPGDTVQASFPQLERPAATTASAQE